MFFNLGGYWAVIIFLFISGYGLYQKYQLNNIPFSFWNRRISRLYIPLWITLILFISLDSFLIDLYQPSIEIVLNFLGIHFNGALTQINAVAWFVEYIMILYGIYWLSSKIPFGENSKLIVLVFLCFLIFLIASFPPVKYYHSIWRQYSVVFPLGVLFAKHQKRIVTFLETKIKHYSLLLVPLIISVFLFFNWPTSVLNDLRPVPLILALIIFLLLYQKINLQSTFLIFIGTYSYEIYLLHMPFMVKYDFFLFRKPFYLFFFVYFVFLLIISYSLAQISTKLHLNIVVPIFNNLIKKINYSMKLNS